MKRMGVQGVLACSALKREYRKMLTSGVEGDRGSKVDCVFVVLSGLKALIEERMRGREHFMPPGLLQSQLDTLEEPTQEEGNKLVFIADISSTVDSISEDILAKLEIIA